MDRIGPQCHKGGGGRHKTNNNNNNNNIKMYFNGGVLQNITADLLVNKFAAFYRT